MSMSFNSSKWKVGVKSQHHTYPLIHSSQTCCISHWFLNFFALDSLSYAVPHLHYNYTYYIPIHPHINTYIHTYARTHTRTHTHTHIYIYIYVHTNIYTHTHLYTHTDIYIHEHARTYIHIYIHWVIAASVRIHTQFPSKH